jgi:XTP/dITP diphosphohydrolase
MRIIFASQNKGKAKEIRGLFQDTGYEIYTFNDFPEVLEVVEDKDTFEGNAKKKAFEAYEKYKFPAIADDSGLCVDQLNGDPGVYSARYAGEGCTYDDNNTKLLNSLKDLPQPHAAKFVTCAVYYDGKDYTVCMGELKGTIIKEKRGTNGFGYDPVFVPEGSNKTLAEMDLAEKNNISHRSRAFKELKKHVVK